jgi:hypothetical protein
MSAGSKADNAAVRRRACDIGVAETVTVKASIAPTTAISTAAARDFTQSNINQS